MEKLKLLLPILLSLFINYLAKSQPIQVKNIPDGSYGFFAALGNLYFFQNDSLWKSDGTPAGTTFVKELSGKAIVYSSGGSYPMNFVEAPFVGSNVFYFTTSDGSDVTLWRSNGTSTGTIAIDTYSNVKPLGILNNEFYYGALNGSSSVLYKVGTGSPVLLKTLDFSPYPTSDPFMFNPWLLANDHEVVSGTLYFRANSMSGAELWKTNGTMASTIKLKDFHSSDQLNEFTNVNGVLYFQNIIFENFINHVELWKSNGTTAGTIRAIQFEEDKEFNRLYDLTVFNGKLFFVVESNFSSYSLYGSDGTEEGTQLLKDYGPENDVFIIGEVNNQLALHTLFEDVSGQLWRTNGTIAGTTSVTFLVGSNPEDFTIVDNTLFYTDHTSRNPGGGPETPEDSYQLWQSDLSDVNTKPVKAIFPGTSFPNSGNLTNVNDVLFFTTPDNGQLQLWKYNPLAPANNEAFFTVVNANTDEDKAWIKEGDTIVVLSDETINIRFNPTTSPQSVRFILNGSVFRTESVAPFSLAGDNSGNYNTWNVSEGIYTLIARQYSGPSATGSLLASDTIHFFIDKLPLPPLVNAGPDQILNSVSTTTLVGTASSPEGTISSVQWSLQSSPLGFIDPVITNPNSLTTTVTGLILPGDYIFRLTVTTSEGAFNVDEVVITVIGQGIISFSLYDADTDQSLFNNFGEGHIFYLSHYSTNNFNIIASTIPETVGSVRFVYDGRVSIENVAPYALYGDVNGDFNPGPLTLGTHTISATPYTGPNATGVAGLTRTVTFHVMISFPPDVNAGADKNLLLPASSTDLTGTATDPDGSVTFMEWTLQSSPPVTVTMVGVNSLHVSVSGLTAPGDYVFRLTATDNTGLTSFDEVSVTVTSPTSQAITSFTLVNADTDQDIFDLAPGATIDLANLPTLNLNIRANTSPATVGSVRFQYDASFNRLESQAPYALFGDNNGNYAAGNLTPGNHTLSGTPYAGPNGSGTAGPPLTISFTVINSTAKTGNISALKAVCYPNPSSDAFQITIPVTVSTEALVGIYDNTGGLFKNLFKGNVQMGEELALNWDVSNIQPGIYLLKVIMGDKVITEKLIVK